MKLNMRLFLLFITGILAIFPLYSNDSNENGISEQPESDIPINYSRDGGSWNTLLSGNVGHSYLGNNNFIVGLDIAMMYVPYGGMRYSIHNLGLDYQLLNNKNDSQSIIRMNYSYFRYLFYYGAGLGISGFYNTSNNDTGIAPKIGGSVFLGIIIINYYYRYNLVLNNVNNNYHETVLSLSINILIND